jgi:rare lipoprotein A
MKPLTLLLMALFLGHSVGASSSSEEFVIEAIQENEEITEIQEAAAVRPLPASKLIEVVQGAASWYGPGLYGRTTANGERFSKGTLTAAHRTLPFGTRVRVTNLSNGRSVVVRINDRGPFKHHRVIDLAHGAASQLQMMQAGEVPVKLEILANGD